MASDSKLQTRPTGAAVEPLAALERHAESLETTPGWIARDEPIFWPEPRSEFVPAHWGYEPLRAALMEASRLVDLSMAERRILALRNPFPGNNFATTRTLSCAYQLMLPGERASTHRHASHALRVILDARGSYSIVDGVRMPMESGDIVLTPGGRWHGHGHEGNEPASWLDGLDIPLTHLLEPMFFEPHPDRFVTATSSTDVSPFRFKADDIARRLDAAKPDEDGYSGPSVALSSPDMAAIGMVVERVPAGFATRRQRSTASRCCIVMQGSGRSVVGDSTFEWRRGDAIAIPTWTAYEHRAHTDAQLFWMSDEPLMRMCNYWRHEAV